MKKLRIITVLAILLAAGISQSHGQTTQLVYNVNITLTGFGSATDTATDSVKLTTKDLIAELGTVTGKTFSPKARLILISDVGASSGLPSFFVRNGVGGPNDDVSVGALLKLELLGFVHKTGVIGSNGAATEYGILRI